MDVNVRFSDRAGGDASIVVLDPSGATMYSRTFRASGGDLSEHAVWAPLTGNWTVSYAYEDFRGYISVHGSARGLPPGMRFLG